MKKRKLLPFIAALTTLSLTSCFFMNHQVIDDILSNKARTSDKSAPTRKDYVDVVSYKRVNTGSTSNMTNTNIGLGYDYHYLPSTGNVKMLVIPVATADYSFDASQLSRIKKGFFGDADETGWESVSSFYKKSSGNKLNITGDVTPVVTLSQTKDELFRKHKTYAQNGVRSTDVILKSVLSALADEKFDFSSYDSNNDGYIDAVWMVYSVPEVKQGDQSDLFWAFTTWTNDATQYSNLYASTYSWASVDFFLTGNYTFGSADAHTFIHETGHMLGLDDYYSYDADGSTNFDTPIGGIDMMDFNIVDHNSFSKYLLGWYKPQVITEEYLKTNNYQITLNSFEDTGKSFLIPSKSQNGIQYNQTAMDEYLLVEFYTPTGLNAQDSQSGYGDSNIRAYTKPGVLVYHVNASIGKLVVGSDNKTIVSDGCVYDALPEYSDKWGKDFLFAYLNSNTQSYSYGQVIDDSSSSFYRTRLISLLPASGKKTTYSSTGLSSNASLFLTKNSLKKSYPNFEFDDGTKPAFDFTVNTIGTSDCSLTLKEF